MRPVPHLNCKKTQAIQEANRLGISTQLANKYKVHRTTLYRWVKALDAIKAGRPTKTFAVVTKRDPAIKYPRTRNYLYVPNTPHIYRLMARVTDISCNRARYVTSECLLIIGGQFEPRWLYEQSERSTYGAFVFVTNYQFAAPLTEELSIAQESVRWAIESISIIAIFPGQTKYESYEYMYNMDQNSIYIDMNPNTTITFTVDDETYFSGLRVLCASATGNKLLPMIVFAGVSQADVHQELLNHPLHPSKRIKWEVYGLNWKKTTVLRICFTWNHGLIPTNGRIGDAGIQVKMHAPLCQTSFYACISNYDNGTSLFDDSNCDASMGKYRCQFYCMEDFYKLGCYQLDHENQTVPSELSYMLTSMKKRTSRKI
ncbi:LOW QUALITY PROTEIN: hypothetical protein PHMEG_00027787 [Phytophthora megakarya]|uniref:HTH psq-type domain-containing protein n=1 Tax=Phytophthora megakarya TaxID=4795 RepID=A0A225V917_9STRA|nr:LOW QUALITY PROTEIN: hypothetical protein PHMEG_00027787 [Phytophthora megakarya]